MLIAQRDPFVDPPDKSPEEEKKEDDEGKEDPKLEQDSEPFEVITEFKQRSSMIEPDIVFAKCTSASR
jgi:hypothetical protein